MSKITSKNLSYDNTLPPFLARLQAQNNSSSRDGRHEFAIARPKKQRSAEDEAEDEPVYFNEESGETLSRKEWEEREKFEGEGGSLEIGTKSGTDDDAKGGEGKEGGEVGKSETREKEKLAAIGAGKKRKVGKIIGGDDDGAQKEYEAVKAKDSTELGKQISAEAVLKDKRAEKPDGAKAKTKTVSKKAKKIKLSFDD